MKLGVFLFHESRDPSKDSQVIDEAVREAQLAEAEGMDAVFLAEHHFDGNCVYVDPPTFAAALAMATSRIKIGFAVLQTSLYHPIRVAEQISLLDNLSKGRMIVGLGRGSMVNLHEYSGYQIEPESAQERFEEIEKILLQCWNTEELKHAGKYWNFDVPMMLRPRPYTKPHPQILRAVASEGSLSAQARQGRPVIMAAATSAGAARNIDIYRKAAREAGVSTDRIDWAISESWVSRTAIIAPTDKEAQEVGLPYFRQMQQYRAAQSSAFEEMAAKTNAQAIPVLCGSPETVMEDFASLAKTGIGGCSIRFRTGPMPAEFSARALKLFMKEIAPELRTSALATA